MKKIGIAIIVSLLLAAQAHAVPYFDILDTTYSATAGVAFNNGGTTIEDNYMETLSNPIDATVEIQDALGRVQSVKCIVEDGYLYSDITDENGDSGAYARTDLWSETVFQPLFNGAGPELTFFHTAVYPYGNNEFIITDDTLGVVIYAPEWDMVPDGERRLLSFDYGDWDMSHTYTLRMALWGSTNAVGWQEYETGTDLYNYVSIPEPAAITLLILPIIGLFALRKRTATGT